MSCLVHEEILPAMPCLSSCAFQLSMMVSHVDQEENDIEEASCIIG